MRPIVFVAIIDFVTVPGVGLLVAGLRWVARTYGDLASILCVVTIFTAVTIHQLWHKHLYITGYDGPALKFDEDGRAYA